MLTVFSALAKGNAPNLFDPSFYKVSFTYDEKEYKGLLGLEILSSNNCLRLKVDDNLEVKIISAFNQKYGQLEYTVWFENHGDKPSKVLKQIKALDAVFLGEKPVLRGIYGDLEYHYAPYEQNLEEDKKEFLNLSGRSTHRTFPYYDLVHGDGGTLMALGWAGTIASSFQKEGNGARAVLQSQPEFEACLLPGEKIRTGLIVLLPYKGRDKQTAWNLWRRWFIECNMPRGDAKGNPIKPFTAMCFNSDTGVEHVERYDGSVAERYTTWKPTLEKLKEKKIIPDVHWFDAGWYSDPAKREVVIDWWGTVGSWDVDPYKWPGETLKEYFSACHEVGMKNLVWFEPERVTDVPSLVTNYGYKAEWGISTGRVINNNLGDEECLQWTLKRIISMLERVGGDIYREDNNSNPAGAWKALDEQGFKKYNFPRAGVGENLMIQGHYRLWDEIIAWQKQNGKPTFLDSCAGGGGRNDIESMRRGIPFMRSDDDRTTIGLRLSMTSSFPYWIPFHGSSNKETIGQLDPMKGPGPDSFVCRASFLPAAWNVGGQVTQNPKLDWERQYKNLKEWNSVKDFLTKDFYVLTPWHAHDDLSGWTVFVYDDPEKKESVLLAFRQEKSEEAKQKVILPFADENTTFQIKDEDTQEIKTQKGKVFTLELPNPRSTLFWRLKR